MEVGIVGLGLIGGSFAKALQRFTEHRVWGMDADADVQQRALCDGVIDGELDDAVLADCDVLLLALYPQACIDFVFAHADRIKKGACVVDLCGVKSSVCAAIVPLARDKGFCFFGGHPMAGREKSGYDASIEDLFCGASMILIPPEDAAEELIARVSDFFRACQFGGICFTTPTQHDGMIAYTSQLAHVVASAYVKSPAALQYKAFSGGSFQDMTRVATLNETMWTELFLANRTLLADEIEQLCARLEPYVAALRSGDAAGLHTLLKDGSQWKARISQGEEE